MARGDKLATLADKASALVNPIVESAESRHERPTAAGGKSRHSAPVFDGLDLNMGVAHLHQDVTVQRTATGPITHSQQDASMGFRKLVGNALRAVKNRQPLNQAHVQALQALAVARKNGNKLS